MQSVGRYEKIYNFAENTIVMKRIYSNLRSITSRVCMAGLALLGFSCSDDDNDEQICMYGTPIAEFEIKGAVTSEDGKPVPDAEVRVTGRGVPSVPGAYDRDTTETDGAYSLRGHFSGGPENILKVVCVPGDASLAADSVEVKLTKTEDGDGIWNTGKGEATVDFRLKKKAAE